MIDRKPNVAPHIDTHSCVKWMLFITTKRTVDIVYGILFIVSSPLFESIFSFSNVVERVMAKCNYNLVLKIKTTMSSRWRDVERQTALFETRVHWEKKRKARSKITRRTSRADWSQFSVLFLCWRVFHSQTIPFGSMSTLTRLLLFEVEKKIKSFCKQFQVKFIIEVFFLSRFHHFAFPFVICNCTWFDHNVDRVKSERGDGDFYFDLCVDIARIRLF